MEWTRIVKSFVVYPKGGEIYSDGATVIEVEDEGGGLFVQIKQEGGEERGVIRLDSEEWPAIQVVIAEAMAVCDQYNKKEAKDETR